MLIRLKPAGAGDKFAAPPTTGQPAFERPSADNPLMQKALPRGTQPGSAGTTRPDSSAPPANPTGSSTFSTITPPRLQRRILQRRVLVLLHRQSPPRRLTPRRQLRVRHLRIPHQQTLHRHSAAHRPVRHRRVHNHRVAPRPPVAQQSSHQSKQRRRPVLRSIRPLHHSARKARTFRNDEWRPGTVPLAFEVLKLVLVISPSSSPP